MNRTQHIVVNGKKGKVNGVKRRPGRPGITLEQVEAIADDVGCGLTREQACMANNVNFRTFNNVLTRKKEYREAFTQGESKRIQSIVRGLVDGSTKYSAGPMFILERTRREQFGRIPDKQVTNNTLIAMPKETVDAIRSAAQNVFGRQVLKQLNPYEKQHKKAPSHYADAQTIDAEAIDKPER